MLPRRGTVLNPPHLLAVAVPLKKGWDGQTNPWQNRHLELHHPHVVWSSSDGKNGIYPNVFNLCVGLCCVIVCCTPSLHRQKGGI